MEEKTSGKIQEINEKNLSQGGQSIHEEAKEDIEAVKEGNKTVDMIERLMTEDEILEVALKNGIYVNMLAPCLAANISLNGMLLGYLSTPMRITELEENVDKMMHIICDEISREPNGLVFFSNGSINVRESIAQSVTTGIATTAILREAMDEGVIERIQNRVELQNQVGLNGMVRGEIGKDVGLKSFEELFEKALEESFENNYKNIDRYNRLKDFEAIFDTEDWSAEEKRQKYEEKAAYEKQIKEMQDKLKELYIKMADMDENSKEYYLLQQDVNELKYRIEEITQKYDSIGNIEKDSAEELAAKEKYSQLAIVDIYGTDEQIAERQAAVDNIMENGSPAEIVAIKSERINKTIFKNLIRDDAAKDYEELSALREKLELGELSEEEKQAFAAKAIKVHFKYNRLSGKDGEGIFEGNQVHELLELAKTSIGNLVPNSLISYENDLKSKHLDHDRLAEYLGKVKGYEHVTIDNCSGVMFDEITQELSTKLSNIFKDRLLEEVMDEPEGELIDKELIASNDKDYIINGINILQRLKEEGSPSNMFKRSILKTNNAGLGDYVNDAENEYDNKKAFYEDKIDDYMRNRALVYYKKYKKFDDGNALDLLTNEESAKILSVVLSTYKRISDSGKEDEISNEVKGKCIEIINNHLGDVVKEDGSLKEEEFVDAYVKFTTNEKTGDGKYRLKREEENVDGIMNYHMLEAIYGIERVLVQKVSEKVEKVKARDAKLIDKEEAERVAEEKGEILDDSAITNPVKEEKKENKDIDKLVTKEEGDKAMAEKGENVNVADLSQIKKESNKSLEESQDKYVEETGNTSEVKNQVQTALINVEDEKKSLLEELIDGVKKYASSIKKSVLKIFAKSSNSSQTGSDSNNSSQGGGNTQEIDDEKKNQINQNLFGKNIELDVKGAQKKTEEAKKAKEEAKLSENGKEEEVEKD